MTLISFLKYKLDKFLKYKLSSKAFMCRNSKENYQKILVPKFSTAVEILCSAIIIRVKMNMKTCKANKVTLCVSPPCCLRLPLPSKPVPRSLQSLFMRFKKKEVVGDAVVGMRIKLTQERCHIAKGYFSTHIHSPKTLCFEENKHLTDFIRANNIVCFQRCSYYFQNFTKCKITFKIYKGPLHLCNFHKKKLISLSLIIMSSLLRF